MESHFESGRGISEAPKPARNRGSRHLRCPEHATNSSDECRPLWLLCSRSGGTPDRSLAGIRLPLTRSRQCYDDEVNSALGRMSGGIQAGAGVKENPTQPEHEVARGLVDRVQGGDSRAEAEIVERYSRGLRFLLRRKLYDTQLVEDFLQETWMVALAKIRSEGLEDPGRLAGYLCGIANNLARGDARRVGRQRTTVNSEIIDLIPDESDNPFRQFTRAEIAGHVKSLLSELTQERDRDILHSFYVREEDKESICSRLGVDGTHFNRVLHRARNRLKEVAQRQAMRSRMHVVN